MGTEASAVPWFENEEELERTLREALMPPEAAPRLRGYELGDELGRGGQGVVFAAIQTATRREVAVKFLLDLPGRTRRARQRFERELELVASLRDPRIVQILDGGITDDGRPFVVMERVVGVAVGEAGVVATARGAGFARPAADPAIGLFVEIAGALEVAHRRGVIHRDLKPSNLLVDRDGVPRVLDFGLAKASGLVPEGFVTSTGRHFVGSLPWASPEQAEGRADAVDVRSDVYALGATFYELVTGRPPCPPGDNLRDTLDAIRTAIPLAPSRLDLRCDRDLEAVLLRALEKDPERRYATAGDLAADLSRILAGEPIEARRETAWRSLVRAARRRRRAAIAATALFAAAVVVGIVLIGLWRRADADSARARATLEFFFDAVSSVDPARDGANVRLVDALERVSTDLDRRLAGEDPAVVLAFRRRLRDLYLKLGRFDRALVEAEAVSVLTARLPAAPASPAFRSRWNGEVLRATALYHCGKLDEAYALFETSAQTLAEAFGPDDADTLGALNGKGQVLKAARRLDDAEALFRQVAGAAPTPENAWIRAHALQHLAHVHELRGRPSEAESPQREAHELFAAALGADDIATLAAASNLGNLLLTLDRPAEAVALLRPTVADFERRCGDEHASTLAAKHNLGVALMSVGQAAEGEAMLQTVYESRRRRLGPTARDTLYTLHELAVAANARGDRARAEALYRQLADARREIGDSAGALLARHNLACLLRETGRAAEAEPLFREIVDEATKLLGARHQRVAVYRGNLARCLATLGRADEARPLLQESLALLEAELGPRHRDVLDLRAALERLPDSSSPR